MKSIRFEGRKWRVHSQTPTKLVLVPANNPMVDWRKKNKLNQRDAAERLGISQGQLARIESGTRTCAPELLSKLHETQAQ